MQEVFQLMTNFTLDTGLIVMRDDARRMIINRLGNWGYSLEARRKATEQVIAPESGHAGYTISALVRAARDICILDMLPMPGGLGLGWTADGS